MRADLNEQTLLSFNKCNTNKGKRMFDLKYKSAEMNGGWWRWEGGCTDVDSIDCRSGVTGRYITDNDKSQQQTQIGKNRNSYK